MGDGQIGLARTCRPNTENQLRPVESTHIGVLHRRTGKNRLLACRYLRSRHLSLVFKRRQCQLIIRSNGNAHGTIHIRRRQLMAFLQVFVKLIEGTACLFCGCRVSTDGKLVTL
ncbi:hypothetical protein D9M69_571630 [compost metagenome]